MPLCFVGMVYEPDRAREDDVCLGLVHTSQPTKATRATRALKAPNITESYNKNTCLGARGDVEALLAALADLFWGVLCCLRCDRLVYGHMDDLYDGR